MEFEAITALLTNPFLSAKWTTLEQILFMHAYREA
jgi:hypothetical protein